MGLSLEFFPKKSDSKKTNGDPVGILPLKIFYFQKNQMVMYVMPISLTINQATGSVP